MDRAEQSESGNMGLVSMAFKKGIQLFSLTSFLSFNSKIPENQRATEYLPVLIPRIIMSFFLLEPPFLLSSLYPHPFTYPDPPPPHTYNFPPSFLCPPSRSRLSPLPPLFRCIFLSAPTISAT